VVWEDDEYFLWNTRVYGAGGELSYDIGGRSELTRSRS